MRRPITATLLALALTGALAAPARADFNTTGTLSGDATLTPTGTPGVFVQNFTGTGDDTTFGAFTTTTQSTIDFRNPPSVLITDGMLTQTFSNGMLFAAGSGSGTANGMGMATATFDLIITGGTGFFLGAKGTETVTTTITLTSPTTTSVTGSYTGSISVVPEPGSLALSAMGAAVAAAVSLLRRRRGE
jgi:hypothetical protein